VVGLSVALTVLILFVFVVASYATDSGLGSLEGREQLTIEITGHQWWWQARYSDPEPSRVFETANEIHVPVGEPVRLDLVARDVIHSLWLPNLSGKKDLIPGRQNSLWLQVDRPGIYRGQCAEFCGLQHAQMALLVIAEPPAAFRAWREAQLRPAARPSTDAARRGEQVFLSSSCMLCHSVRGTSSGGRLGPDLTHLASRTTIAAGTLPNRRGYLAGWIADPQHQKPGNQMPTNGLSPPDFQALLAYLGSLQ
jgi:cytochrome c oxidase subunit 2